jgi:hypothetical protein
MSSIKLEKIERYSSDPRKEHIEDFRGNVRHIIEMIVWGEKAGLGFFE